MVYYSIQTYFPIVGKYVQVAQAKTIKECKEYLKREYKDYKVSARLEKRTKRVYTIDKVVKIINL